MNYLLSSFGVLFVVAVVWIYEVGTQNHKELVEHSSKYKFIITHDIGRMPETFLVNSYKVTENGQCLESEVKNVCGNFSYSDNPDYIAKTK